MSDRKLTKPQPRKKFTEAEKAEFIRVAKQVAKIIEKEKAQASSAE